MKYLTTLTLSFLLAGFTLSLPATVIAAPYDLQASAPTATVVEKTQLLFIMRAEHGVITREGDSYKLVLTGMDNHVLFFSDRPVRDAGQVKLTRFMKGWDEGTQSFKANPPNAIFLHESLPINATGFSRGIALVLSNPVATAHGWTFDVKAISGQLEVGQYDKVALFIDAWQYAMPQSKKFGAPKIT